MRKYIAGVAVALSVMAFGVILGGGTCIAQEPKVPPASEPQTAQPQERLVRIAVLEFKNPPGAQGGAERETALLRDALVTQLVETRKFKVAERQDMDSINKELGFNQSGMVNADTAQKVGRLSGAAYLLMGTLTSCEYKTTQEAIPYTTNGYVTNVSISLRVDMRVVETDTGEIICAQSGIVKRQLRNTATNAADSMNNARDEVVKQLVQYILDACYPVKVADFKDEVAYLNRGKNNGLVVGARLEAFALGKAIVDPDTGAKLGKEETRIAALEITEVNAQMSKARVISWETETHTMPIGTVCRRIGVGGTAPTGAPPQTDAPAQPKLEF